MSHHIENLRELHRVAGKLIELAEKDPSSLEARPMDLVPFVLSFGELREKRSKAASTIAILRRAVIRMGEAK